MIYTEDVNVYATVLNSVAGRDRERLEGIHLSDLDLCLKKPFYRKLEPIPITDEALLTFFMGWAVQHEISGTTEEERHEVDGILMGLDALINGTFIEIKSTKKSLNNFDLLEMKHWIMRMAGYCKAKEVDYCYLGVIFINGNYKPPKTVLKTYKVQFSEKELEATWKEILDRKRILEKALESNEPPEDDRHYDWECGYCENNIPGRCYGYVDKPKK